MQQLREIAAQPVRPRHVDALVGAAIAVWTFGQVLFSLSLVGSLPFVIDNYLGSVHVAIVGGCLVAAIASKEFDFDSHALAALGLSLFFALAMWRNADDAMPLVLLLLALTARDMSVSKLARFHVAGTLAGMLVVMLLSAVGITGTVRVLVGSTFYPSFGFVSREVFASLVMSVVVGIALATDDADALVPQLALCAFAVAVLLVPARQRVMALFLAAMGAFLALCRFAPRLVDGWMARPWLRMAVAALPFVLFVASNDSWRLFGVDALDGAYRWLIDIYGYGVLIALYVLYVRGVLVGASNPDGLQCERVLLCACVLFSVLLVRDLPPMRLEFNCALLVLLRGMRPLPTMSGEAPAASGRTEGR